MEIEQPTFLSETRYSKKAEMPPNAAPDQFMLEITPKVAYDTAHAGISEPNHLRRLY